LRTKSISALLIDKRNGDAIDMVRQLLYDTIIDRTWI